MEWKSIVEIFNSALEYAPSERATFLDEVCGGNEALRAEVGSLLLAHDKASDFMETPVSSMLSEFLSEEQTEPLVDRQVGPFKIIKEIGAGAVGRVYLAYDTNLERPNALKFLFKKFTLKDEDLRRFKQEARIASALNHYGIVTIHRLEQEGDDHYIVMEYVEGETLRGRLTSSPIELDEALRITIQVADALAHAHKEGIVHRDIKPENIMLPSDGRPVKVLDFGIAKVTTEILQQQIKKAEQSDNGTLVKTIPGMLLGTTHYMSPEQASAHSVDVQTDIWSLGVVLYEMIAGRVPFEGENLFEVIRSIHTVEPQLLSSFVEGIPEEFQRVVSKSLAKNKSERYQTISDLQNDLIKLWEGTRRSFLWLPQMISRDKQHPNFPDILTPGLPSNALLNILTPYVGTQLAQRMEQLSELSISAVEDGNFDLHVSLGEQIERDAQGFPEIEAAGRYFAAEGYRLQADLESDSAQKRLLLQRAAEQYELSLEKNPNNARAIRGLARVYEVQGEYDKALNKFKQAEGIAQIQLTSGEPTNLHLHLSHEILRITRHYIHCILEIMATNPQSSWHKDYKKRELEGYVIASENLHRENMRLFKDREQWARIEWFMALIFFGKAWGRLGNIQQKRKCLIDALLIRRRMLRRSSQLTNVERANINWWLSVALTEPRDTSLAGVEELAQTLEQGTTPEILCKIDAIVFPFVPLWEQESM